jgi:site-specific DNA-cytosine methylase
VLISDSEDDESDGHPPRLSPRPPALSGGGPTAPSEWHTHTIPMADDYSRRRNMPQYDGQSGIEFHEWYALAKQYILDKTWRADKSFTPAFTLSALLEGAFPEESSSMSWWESVREDLVDRVAAAQDLAFPDGETIGAPRRRAPDGCDLLAEFHKLAVQEFGKPTPDEITHLRDMRMGVGKGVQPNESPSQFGARFTRHYNWVSAKGTVHYTELTASALYVCGLDKALQSRVEDWLHQADDPTLGDIVAKAHRIWTSMQSLLANARLGAPGAGGRGTRVSVDDMSASEQRQLLKQLQAKGVGGSRQQPELQYAYRQDSRERPKLYCATHGMGSHLTRDCRAPAPQRPAPQRAALMPPARTRAPPRAMQARTDPPRAQHPREEGRVPCPGCGNTRHTADNCWKLHPEKAPQGWKPASSAPAGGKAGRYQQRTASMAAGQPAHAHTHAVMGDDISEDELYTYTEESRTRTAMMARAQPAGAMPPAASTRSLRRQSMPVSFVPVGIPEGVEDAAAAPAQPESGKAEAAPAQPESGNAQPPTPAPAVDWGVRISLPLDTLLQQSSFTVQDLLKGTQLPAAHHAAEAPAHALHANTTPCAAPRAHAPPAHWDKPQRDKYSCTDNAVETCRVSQPEEGCATSAQAHLQRPTLAEYLAKRACIYLHRNSPERPEHSLCLRVNGQLHTPPHVMRDSGADINLISAAYARQVKLPWGPDDVEINVSTGGTMPVLGRVTAPVEVVLCAGTPQETVTLTRMYVVDEPTYDVLLGVSADRAVGGYTDPVTGCLHFRPKLQQGDLDTLHAIPMRVTTADLEGLHQRSPGTSSAAAAAPLTAAQLEEEEEEDPRGPIACQALRLPLSLGTLSQRDLESQAVQDLLQEIWEEQFGSGVVGMVSNAGARLVGNAQLAYGTAHHAVTLAVDKCADKSTPAHPSVTHAPPSTPSSRAGVWRKTTSAMVKAIIYVLLLSMLGMVAAGTHAIPAVSAVYQADTRNVSYPSSAAHTVSAPHGWEQHTRWRNCKRSGHAHSAVTMTLPEGETGVLPTHRFVKDPDNGWIYGHHPGFTAAQQRKLEEVITARRHCFAYSMADLPGYTGGMGPFEISLDTDQPVFLSPRRQSPLEKDITDEKCGELLTAGMIAPAPSDTKYASRVTTPAKKDAEGNWTDRRFCVDFRRANEHTPQDRYGLHLPDDLFRSFGDDHIFSKLDLRSGFHQIPIAPDDCCKTSFWWGNKLYMYLRMPFGAKNASAKFQRIMDFEIGRAGLAGRAKSFIDDVMVHSANPEAHIRDVAQVLDMLHSVGLRAHPDKSLFGTDVVEYLGHNVSRGGLTPMAARVLAITALRPPTNVSELRSLMGFIGYYRDYVPNYSAIAHPIRLLTKLQQPWEWGPLQDAALDKLKREISAEGRARRRANPAKPYILHTDWSNLGVGAVLSQLGDDGREYMVAAISRSLNKHEANYDAYKGEMLAAVWAVKTLRPYLHGASFTLVTDHQPLLWLMGNTNLTGQHARWALSLQDYTFTVQHRPGVTNQNADGLSRLPRADATDISGARMDGPAVPRAAPLAELGAHDGVQRARANATRARYSAYAMLAVMSLPAVARQTDEHIPTPTQLLEGNMGSPLEDQFDPPVDDAATGRYAHTLRTRAAAWVRAAARQLRQLRSGAPRITTPARAPERRLNTSLIASSFFDEAQTEGITVYEPFGGMCAGLEMALRNGIRVRRYIYGDISAVSRRVAALRGRELSSRYPSLLPLSATVSMFAQLPQDITRVTPELLRSAGATDGSQWLVVAGWPCQDLSPAGQCRGLEGTRSGTLKDLVRVLVSLQHLQPGLPPGYILENVPLQHNFSSAALRTEVHRDICDLIGEPATLDAARFGSYAHRLRNFWTNLASAAQLNAVVATIQPPAGRLVADILDEGRTMRPVQRTDAAPFYPANVAGQPRVALPTLTAYPRSRQFAHAHSPGAVHDSRTGEWGEPNPDERERALGYTTGATAAPGVTSAQRHEVTGAAMDIRALQSLYAIANAMWALRVTSVLRTAAQALKRMVAFSSPARRIMAAQGWRPGMALGAAGTGLLAPIAPTWRHPRDLHGVGAARYPPATPTRFVALGGGRVQPTCNSETWRQRPSQEQRNTTQANALVADVATGAEKQRTPGQDDIWADPTTLSYVQNTAQTSSGTSYGTSTGVTAAERQRAQRRSMTYAWERNKLYRKMGDGSTRLVPPPAQRADLIREMHDTSGHFGERRTVNLLMRTYWWHGMYKDVSAVVRSCAVCDRVRASFNATPMELSPLPIEGLFYRWGVDLCGPFPATARGNTYVMVMVEYFSKTIELAPLKAKEAVNTRAAFLDCVLGRYGACAEVVTDQGTEFQGAFDDLLVSAYIDHRMTAPNHPQADGLAERAVQTVKRALRKRCEVDGRADHWDEELPWIRLGYNASAQAASGFSPYYMLYAHHPVVPPAIKERMEEPITIGDSAEAQDQAALVVLQRADAIRKASLVAGNNLKIAQHRDALRYSTVRGGGYIPRMRKFEVGDYVYVRHGAVNSTLQIPARREVLRVLELRPSGAVVLQGKCGRTIASHTINCAPCHLPIASTEVDVTLARPDLELACEECNFTHDDAKMLLCDYCGTGWHMYCLDPPLGSVPKGVWLCHRCTTLGITPHQVQQRQQRSSAYGPDTDLRAGELFPSASTRQRDERARLLDGRVVRRETVNPSTRRREPVWGRLTFLGASKRPHYFSVQYTSGLTETMSYTVAQRSLQPEGTALPPSYDGKRTEGMANYAGSRGISALPSQWPLHTREGVLQALTTLLPGTHGQAHATRLSRQMPGQANFLQRAGQQRPGQPQCVATTLPEVEALLQIVDLSQAPNVLDPWSGTGGVTDNLRTAGLHVRSNDINPAHKAHTHEDALQPVFYRRRLREGPVDAIVTSPWFAMLDLALPLAVLTASKVVCAHVPGHYVTDATAPRRAWLAALKDQGRLHFIWGLPKGEIGRRCMWLLVFATPELRDTLIKPEYCTGSCLTFIS